MPAGKFKAVPITRAYAKEYLGWQYEPPYDFYTIAPEYWEREMSEIFQPAPGNCYYAALYDGKMAGYFELHHRKETVEIGVALRPELTGKGHGRAFLACVLEQAWARYQPKEFTLCVAAWNERAKRLYRAIGFKEIGSAILQANGRATQFILMQMQAAGF